MASKRYLLQINVSPMQQLFLHIGTHKTGTTSIQRFLDAIQEDLLSDGILYPTTGRLKEGSKSGHHLLALSILKEGDYDEQGWFDVLEEICAVRPKVVVLSSEGFKKFSSQQIKQIKGFTDNFSVKIVIYLRNHFDYMVSLYKGNVKNHNRYPCSFRTYCEEHIQTCNYDRLLKRWIEGFGQEHVEIKLYDKIRQGPGLLPDLVNMLELDPRKYARLLSKSIQRNVSPADEVINLIRILNATQNYVGSGARLTKAFSRMRKSLLIPRPMGRFLLGLGNPLFSKPLYRDEDVIWLRTRVKEWKTSFLDTYVDAEDHKYFEF